MTFEDQDTMSPQNTGIPLPSDTMPYPRRMESAEFTMPIRLLIRIRIPRTNNLLLLNVFLTVHHELTIHELTT